MRRDPCLDPGDAGLLDVLDREELQGVVAHELGHIANLDSRHEQGVVPAV